MRIIKCICTLILISISFVTFYVVSNYYDTVNDRFTFADLNVVEVKEETGATERINRPKISFSNLYNLKYKYYQIAGIYFVNGFLVSLLLVGIYQTQIFKVSVNELIQDTDNLITLFMSSVTLGLILTVTQIFIYNHYFFEKNNANIQKYVTSTIMKN